MPTQPIEWWDRDRFKGRVNTITTFDEKDGHTFVEQNKIDVPDEDIICDLCSDPIDEFPCAVMGGHALCKKCRVKACIEPGDDEYFESFLYACGTEDPKPRVNFGGRKKRDAV